MRKAFFALIFLSIILVSCSHPPAKFDNTPVFLIVIDTLRADHVSVFNKEAKKTSTWEELADDGIAFMNAYTHIPLTLPSHVTMFTGLIPPHSGVRDNIGFKYEKKEKTLAEWIKEHGKKTAGFISAIVLHRRTGINRGFDFYEDKIENKEGALSLGAVQRKGKDTIKLAEEWIEKQADPNFFVFLHIYEPHSPYNPPEEFRKEGQTLYEGEVLYADYLIGKFVDFLKKKKLYNKSLIILAADHGEGLKNHKEAEHGVFLYNEAIHVPLVLKLPYNERPLKKVKKNVALTDIFPTICDFFRMKCPHQMDGISLLKTKDRKIYSESLYGKYHYGWAPQYSLIEKNFHFILSPIREFYNLEKDPMERKNIYGFSTSKEMEKELKAMVSNFKEDKPQKVDPEFIKKLQTLGYVGTIHQETKKKELPDPKTKIYLLEKLGKALSMARVGKNKEAAKILNEILEEEPDMEEALTQAARINEEAGNFERAIELYKELIKRRPNDISPLLGIASVYHRMGEYDKSLEHINLVLEKNPKMALPYSLKAMVYYYKKDFKKFDYYLKKALKINPDLDHAHYLMGLNFIRLGRILDAKKEFLKVEEKNKRGYIDLHFNLGVIYTLEGKLERAKEEYRKEMKFFPNNPKPYVNLAILLRREGDLVNAIHTLLVGEKLAPAPETYYLISLFYLQGRNPGAASKWLKKGLKRFPGDTKLITLKNQFPGI